MKKNVKSSVYKTNTDKFLAISKLYESQIYDDSTLYFEKSFDDLTDSLTPDPFTGKITIERYFAGNWIQTGIEGQCILNFASAKYAGGGVQHGSIAQEEDICRNTLLYFYLREFSKDYYETGKLSGTDHLLQNFLIYSKDVPTINSDLSLGAKNDYITSAAPDLRGLTHPILQPEKLARVWVNRIKAVLASAKKHQAKKLVLGPWGCGVFKNDPEFVYSVFNDLIKKYGGGFEEITFLVPDETNYEIFKHFND